MKTYTKVIFRKFKGENGSVIALFPEILGNDSPYNCLSYQHMGQHDAASVCLVNWTLPATAKEYAPLLKELKAIGYKNLKVVKRFTRANLEARKEALKNL